MTAQSEKQKLGIQASNEAKSELIKKHKDEFDELHRAKRTALGLNPNPGSQALTLAEKIEKAQKHLNDLMAQQAA